MPLLARPGCDLHYELHGAGPPLVFAHGLGGCHLSWWQQLAHFAPRFTCVTFAARGFGPSHEPPGGPGPAAFTADLLALLDHLGLDSVALVAQSMGGWPATEIAARHPERVRGLVLANSVGSFTHPELDAIFADFMARELPPPRGVHPAAGARLAREQPAMHMLYSMLDALSPALDKAALRRALIAGMTTPVDGLRVPLLCITSDEDIVISPDAVTWLAGHVPGATLHVEPRTGHSVYWERPAAFNRVVDEFLAASVYPRGA